LGVYAVPVSKKLPWMQINTIPEEFTEDVKEKKNSQNRYYLCKIVEWNQNDLRPTCRIISSIGEAGNLKAESTRLLRTFDINTDSYEVAEGQDNSASTENKFSFESLSKSCVGPVFDSLKVFIKDIDSESGEWVIPQAEIDQRLDLREKRIFTIDPVTAKDLDDALSID